MIQIRQNIFETNSSSSHSVVVCDKTTWKNFLEGKLVYNVLNASNGYPTFCTWKDIKKYIVNEIKNIPYPNNWQELNSEELHTYMERKRQHALVFFEETFYSIDELENYHYDGRTKKADLDYYFG